MEVPKAVDEGYLDEDFFEDTDDPDALVKRVTIYHRVTHTHDGSTHTHVIEHLHDHAHVISEGKHGHTHSVEELENVLGHNGCSSSKRA